MQSQRTGNVDSKSQLSTQSRKVSMRGDVASKQKDDNLSSQRTFVSSSRQQHPHNQVKFKGYEDEDDHKYRNLDLHLCEDPNELMLQRKQRFE